MLAIVTIPQPGTNNIAIANELFKRFEDIKKDMPADVTLQISYDQTKFIRKSISEVKETLLVALQIKAFLKSIGIDVRMSIGIGEKSFKTKRISERMVRRLLILKYFLTLWKLKKLI